MSSITQQFLNCLYLFLLLNLLFVRTAVVRTFAGSSIKIAFVFSLALYSFQGALRAQSAFSFAPCLGRSTIITNHTVWGKPFRCQISSLYDDILTFFPFDYHYNQNPHNFFSIRLFMKHISNYNNIQPIFRPLFRFLLYNIRHITRTLIRYFSVYSEY